MLGQVIGGFAKFGLYLWDFATKTIPEFIGKVITFFKELPSKIWDAIIKAWEFITKWGSELINRGITATTEFINKVVNFFKELPSKLWKLGIILPSGVPK